MIKSGKNKWQKLIQHEKLRGGGGGGGYRNFPNFQGVMKARNQE